MTARRYFTWTLTLFVAAFLVLPSSKMVNNFYYVLMAIPGLYLLLRNFRLLRPVNLAETGFLVLCLYVATYAMMVQPKVVVHTLYVVVFVYTASRFVDADFFD